MKIIVSADGNGSACFDIAGRQLSRERVTPALLFSCAEPGGSWDDGKGKGVLLLIGLFP